MSTRGFAFLAFVLSGLLAGASAFTPGRAEGDEVGYATLSIEGFTVHVQSGLADPADEIGREAVALLRAKLLDVRRAVPAGALSVLRTVPIWVDREHPKFPCAVYHPSRTWLEENGCDPRMARGVHIANASNFLEWSHEQPAMVLHELAHAFHDRMSATDRAQVDAAYARVAAAKDYEKVLRASGVEDRHYALENPSEYFAEATEAYFGTNDFYPFVRAELARHDPATASLVRELWSR
ncbi:MAG: metallopeptidase [Planctomycetota bacterium]|nr:metallopeptidase [Planctomycetota bacterium]